MTRSSSYHAIYKGDRLSPAASMGGSKKEAVNAPSLHHSANWVPFLPPWVDSAKLRALLSSSFLCHIAAIRSQSCQEVCKEICVTQTEELVWSLVGGNELCYCRIPVLISMLDVFILNRFLNKTNPGHLSITYSESICLMPTIQGLSFQCFPVGKMLGASFSFSFFYPPICQRQHFLNNP